jgi:amidohydrolase
LGWLGIPDGPLMAGADTFKIVLEGKGGHGALPDQTVDPIIAAAQIISALQTIVSRNISPLQSAVVSATRVDAGETWNVIPQTAEIYGTIRAFETEVHEKVVERFEQLVSGVSGALGCKAELDIHRLTPAVINTAAVAKKVAAAASGLLPEAEIDHQYRTMVSEDMALFMERIPGCYFLVGSANPERGLNFGHHHPRFDFDEQALPRAAALMSAAAMELLG